MKTTLQYNGITWIDITKPSRDEIVDLINTLHIDQVVAEELLVPTSIPKLDSYSEYIYLVTRFPRIRVDDGKISGKPETDFEIDFVLTRNTLVTVHHDSIIEIHEAFKSLETIVALNNTIPDFHAGHLFVRVMRHFYATIAVQLRDINTVLEKAEFQIFEHREKEMVRVLSECGRRLVDLERSVQFHETVLRRFREITNTIFDADYAEYSNKLINEFHDLADILHSHKRILSELRHTNDSLLSQKTNEMIKVLTLISFLVLPVSIATDTLFAFTEVNNISKVAGAMIAAFIAIACLLVQFRRLKWI